MSLTRKLLFALLFFLPAAYSIPGRIYFGLMGLKAERIIFEAQALLTPAVAFSFIVISLRLVSRTDPLNLRDLKGHSFYVLLLWFLSATLSLIANFGTNGVLLEYISGYLSFLMVYLAFFSVKLDSRDVTLVFISISIGALFPLLHGLYEYLLEWGLPDAETLLMSRYDLTRMERYSIATFGNVSNTAAFLVLLTPAFIMLFIDGKCKPLVRIWFLLCMLLSLAHLLIVQSRAAFIVIIFSTMATLFFLKKARLWSMLLLIALIVVTEVVFSELDVFYERLYGAALLTNEDNSVYERKEAIEVAWNIFQNNWLSGVGPAATRFYSQYDAAHQFFVAQAAEHGILGLVASVLLVLVIFCKYIRIFLAGSIETRNRVRYLFLIGTTSYFLYGVIAGISLNISVVNTWICLAIAMLALSESDLEGMGELE